MKAKVYIRADGNSEIGLGHLVRCMALAHMLKSDFDVCFVCKEAPETIQHEIRDANFLLQLINSEEEFFTLLNGKEIVVLDHYGLDSFYQKRVKETGCKLVCIDDLHDKEFYADLIINHAPGIKAQNYKAQPYTQFALGTDYALLRPAFLEAAKTQRHIDRIETVLICFGGADSKNLTQQTLETVLKYKEFKKVIVITGSAYLFKEQLDITVKSDERAKHYHSVGEQEMAGFLLKSDLAIVPASGILLEALACGCRVISGMYADNQKFLFDAYNQAEAFVSAKGFLPEDIFSALNKTNEKDFTYHTIDGCSDNRLLKAFNQFKIENKIIVRRVHADDLMQTYKWASDPEIRKFFFNCKPVRFEEHKNWFLNKLQNSDCYYYIGFLNGKAFGSIRFDIDSDSAYISYLIDPLQQKKGLGTALLKQGLTLLIHETDKKTLTIYAEVLLSNLASMNVFKKFGFSCASTETFKIFKKHLTIKEK